MNPDGAASLLDAESVDEIAVIDAVRCGDRGAFGLLYTRHEPFAHRFACKLLGTVQGADDLVAEAFAKVFERIASGGGPTTAFRSYLLTTVRTTWYKQLAGDRMIDRYADPSVLPLATSERDPIEERLDVTLALQAFACLPERWQRVLWHQQIENASTTEIAGMLGMRPNAVAALAFRARDALRIAYLQLHVKTGVVTACQESSDNLAAWLCGRLNRSVRKRIERHLVCCDWCRESAREVGDLLAQIRRMAPLTGGRSSAVRYPDSDPIPPPVHIRSLPGGVGTDRQPSAICASAWTNASRVPTPRNVRHSEDKTHIAAWPASSGDLSKPFVPDRVTPPGALGRSHVSESITDGPACVRPAASSTQE